MKTNWDYTNLADAYLKRPDYSNTAIDAMLSISKLSVKANICDVGAGVGHLTLVLANKGFQIKAVEPNDAMRSIGKIRTKDFKNINWHEGTGEETGQQSNSFQMVTFGSSFNVCDRKKALIETSRILQPKGWFACMWNHRSLENPIQSKIESIIKSHIPKYGYGTRREDQTNIINQSNLFGPVIHLDSMIEHKQNIKDCIEAWKSHATLQRQAGGSFDLIINEINSFLNSLDTSTIIIPYKTNLWLTQLLG